MIPVPCAISYNSISVKWKRTDTVKNKIKKKDKTK